MSSILAQTLGRSEQAVTTAINKLEKLAGSPSEDLRLLSENKTALRNKILRLGLDPDDTTGEELYGAILQKYEIDSQSLEKTIGIQADSEFDKKISRAIELTKLIAGQQEAWALKAASARKLLRTCQPKRLMKQLNYRSLDSMLKREAIDKLLLTAPFCESMTWQKFFHQTAAKFDTADYTVQPIKLVILPESKFSQLAGPSSGITTSNLAAATAIWPASNLQKADTLGLALSLIGGMEELGAEINLNRFSALHPALRWWNNSERLLFVDGGETVSLNLRDAAINHLQNLDYASRLQQHGQRSLWRELISRYKKYSHSISDLVPVIESELSGTIEQTSPVTPIRFATETVEA